MSQRRSSLNRRDFLGAASMLTLAPAVYAAPSNTIRLGLVGCGGRGAGAANHALNAGDDVRLVAVCDVDRVRAEQALKKPERL
jgi:predicted homoserine dehydrogenase-like protein